LNDARVELGESQIGIVIDADDVASAQLELGSTVGSAVYLIVFVKRQVRSSIEPVFIGIVGALIVDPAFDQADACSTYDRFIRQNQRTKRNRQGDHQSHQPESSAESSGSMAGERAGKSVKDRHNSLRVIRVLFDPEVFRCR
jgi:hypothetical protein